VSDTSRAAVQNIEAVRRTVDKKTVPMFSCFEEIDLSKIK